ncbi:MAG TPA: carboxypeptidase-like regulatory domain-containing protein [Acidimicrobiales bacterium]|nr:carboxypeptidase-like regulatory domain-containing protein [Acidimicrobiales bacterium]
MRVELLTPLVQITPGQPAWIDLEITNTGQLIDGVVAGVLGLDPAWVRREPDQLPLFPDATGRIRLELTLPRTYPAGQGLLKVELRSTIDATWHHTLDVLVEVAPVHDTVVALSPNTVVGGKQGDFDVTVTNRGNRDLEIALLATDPERVLRFEVFPTHVFVPPGQTAVAHLTAMARRPWFGSPVPRALTVTAEGGDEAVAGAGTFTQKPYVARGVLTILTLLAIIGLWATVFTVGVSAVLGSEELKKEVPGGLGGLLDGTGTGSFDPAAVAGSITGTVTASTNGQPLERITVEAFRVQGGVPTVISSAATAEDGSFELANLLPAGYLLSFSAPGFETRWFPNAGGFNTAESVRVRPTQETAEVDQQLAGLPGSLSGQVAAASGAPIDALVEIREVVDDVRSAEVVRVVASGGAFRADALPTPASYELTFLAPEFQDQVVLADLDGGEQAVLNTVRMDAAGASFSGTVSDANGPLGGVTITAVSGTEEFTTVTPTSGAVGTYELVGLPSPATFLVTYSLDGFASQTIAIDLGPGEQRTGVNLELIGGSGTVSGLVTDGDGTPLGGVEVSVTGGEVAASTTTLTAGDVGAYVVSGLPTPGIYILTFSLEGYERVTIAVDFVGAGSQTGIDAVLQQQLGAIEGTVTVDGAPTAGVAVSVTDGEVVRETITADSPTGRFRFNGLPAGSYAVTFTTADGRSRTALVQLAAGDTSVVDEAFTAGSG